MPRRPKLDLIRLRPKLNLIRLRDWRARTPAWKVVSVVLADFVFGLLVGWTILGAACLLALVHRHAIAHPLHEVMRWCGFVPGVAPSDLYGEPYVISIVFGETSCRLCGYEVMDGGIGAIVHTHCLAQHALFTEDRAQVFRSDPPGPA